MLELMVVIVIVGILATLAYSGLTEVIFVNRAKETAQTIRTFTERALMDAKRQDKVVNISISGTKIIATDNATKKEIYSETLQGFSATPSPPVSSISNCFNGGVDSKVRIGISGIAEEEGYFAACFNGYCGGTAKLKNENSFKAYIRKGSNKPWEAL
jgi:prepilin-type N-terminal cleavage/methylation domain-containing protein